MYPHPREVVAEACLHRQACLGIERATGRCQRVPQPSEDPSTNPLFLAAQQQIPAAHPETRVAQVSLVTKSGTNDFHGTLFYYLRDNELGARNPRSFNPLTGEALKPVDRRHQFGGTIGGPLYLPRFGEGGHLGGVGSQ